MGDVGELCCPDVPLAASYHSSSAGNLVFADLASHRV
jgi:hypothetical protein